MPPTAKVENAEGGGTWILSLLLNYEDLKRVPVVVSTPQLTMQS